MTFAQAQDDARRALESLQEVVRGIHPAVLTDRGLLEAVEELATRLPLPVRVEADGMRSGARLDAGVESAAYFFVSEALGNVLKHAGSARVCVRLALDGDGLAIEVSDDGCGFDLHSQPVRGLRGLIGRIEALGGQVSLVSAPLRGTSVRAQLPSRVISYV